VIQIAPTPSSRAAHVTNFREGWQAADLHRVLNDASARADLIDNIQQPGGAQIRGVNIDLEELAVKDGARLVEFMRLLRASCAAGLL